MSETLAMMHGPRYAGVLKLTPGFDRDHSFGAEPRRNSAGDLSASAHGTTRTVRAAGLVHAESGYPVSFTLIVALVVWRSVVFAIVSMEFNVGPFD